MAVQSTHYSVRSHGSWKDLPNLKNWVIEGSRDGKSWPKVDRRSKNEDLNERSVTRTFAIGQCDAFRMIRLRQIGLNHEGSQLLVLSAFELFRSVFDSVSWIKARETVSGKSVVEVLELVHEYFPGVPAFDLIACIGKISREVKLDAKQYDVVRRLWENDVSCVRGQFEFPPDKQLEGIIAFLREQHQKAR
jgi:hypothetical protein